MNKELAFNELYTECCVADPDAGLSYAIQTCLKKFSRDERQEIVSKVKENCAPLFAACKKGNVEIVKYLIEQCDAEVEQRGVYEFAEDKSIHFVTPLWCASVLGKHSVVRCLVEHGANVNSASGEGSTAVRSACFMTHYEIVTYLVENHADILKPNYKGVTCLMNSVQSVPLCKFLIQHGADVHSQDIDFNTALHYAIEEQRFDTTKFLLDKGADPFIKNIYGGDALQIACLEGDAHVLDYLCEKYRYSKERIAEAHELMGSTFLEEHNNLQKCLYHWRIGVTLRYTEKPFLKALISKAAYDFSREFTSFVELDNISADLDAMHIQSLLVSERILGPLHGHMSFRLWYRGAVYADGLQYQRCINLWKYAASLRIQKDGLLHSTSCKDAQVLVQMFLEFHKKSSDGMLAEHIDFNDVLQSMRMLVFHFEESIYLLSIRPVFKTQEGNFDKILTVLIHQIYVLYVIPKTSEQIVIMKKFIRDILRIQPRSSNGHTLLHLSKTKTLIEESQDAIFPNSGVAELLLQCGANVGVVNDILSTPLATLISNYNPDAIKVFFRYGDYLDPWHDNGY